MQKSLLPNLISHQIFIHLSSLFFKHCITSLALLLYNSVNHFFQITVTLSERFVSWIGLFFTKKLALAWCIFKLAFEYRSEMDNISLDSQEVHYDLVHETSQSSFCIPWRILVITLWEIDGAFWRLNDIPTNSKWPFSTINTFFWMSLRSNSIFLQGKV